jgi:hypothetical protein
VKDVLEETRTIMIAGKPEVFFGYVRLRERAEGLLQAIGRIEAALPAEPLAASVRWAEIGGLADVLAEVVAAQQQWLADNDADLLRVIETFRRNFAAMRDSGYTIEWEDV